MEIKESLVNNLIQLSKKKEHTIIAICGAADLGKSYFAKELQALLHEQEVCAGHLTMDSYLLPRSKRISLGVSGYDPQSYDIDSLKTDLQTFLNSAPVFYKEYNHERGVADGEDQVITTCNVLILDGLHSMHSEINSLIDYAIFIFTRDSKLQKIRHQADISKRRQSVDFSLKNLVSELERYKHNV